MTVKVTVNFSDQRPQVMLFNATNLDEAEEMARHELTRQGLEFKALQSTIESKG